MVLIHSSDCIEQYILQSLFKTHLLPEEVFHREFLLSKKFSTLCLGKLMLLFIGMSAIDLSLSSLMHDIIPSKTSFDNFDKLPLLLE